MEKFVRIQSNQTIRVTPGLQHDDATKKNSDVPNRMKINPMWPTMMVTIFQGSHLYPSEIANWPVVKALAKDKVLTIGGYESGDGDSDAESAQKAKDDQIEALKDFEKKAKAKEKSTLESIAEGE